MNPSERIDQLIAGLTDWRGKTLASVRKTILEADREIIEEWKWMGSPVWSRDGIIEVGNSPQREGEAELFPRGEPPGPPTTLQRGLRSQGAASDRLPLN